MSTLYPQLDWVEAKRCVRELGTAAGQGFEPAFSHPRQEFSPLGGQRASPDRLRRLRESTIDIARTCGWPNDGGLAARRMLDRCLARHLHTVLDLSPHQASRPGVWQFMCCLMFADLVDWRWPNGSGAARDAHFMGGNRNLLGRLWWRAEVLRDEAAEDPYWILDAMHEDELVQILERSSIARSRLVARELARGFVRMSGTDANSPATPGRMELMRDACKRILRMGAVISFDVLTDDHAGALAKLQLQFAAEALAHRRAERPASPRLERADHVSARAEEFERSPGAP